MKGSIRFGHLSNACRTPPISISPFIKVEEIVFRELLIVGRWMLQAFLDMAGSGDVGPTMIVAGDSPADPDQELPRLEQTRKRPYLSIFGEIDIERTCYGHDRVEAVPLDAQLHLPQRQYSYLLQQWLGAFVVDDAHAEAVRKLETILGLEIAVKASEDLNREQACDVEPFQNNLPVPEPTEEGPILVVTADCKGVPLVRSALEPEEAAEPPLPALANQRRGKGEKANKKKMAAVGAVYTIDPFVRTAEEVIDEVMREKAAKRRPRPAHKRVRAELLVGKVALFLWLADEVMRRNPQGTKPLVFLSDGERALHDRQSEYLPENVVCILDLFHVMERLWKVAWCFFNEATQRREAHQWVEERLRRLLEGKVDSVIRGMRYQSTQRGLEGTETENRPGRGGVFRAQSRPNEVRRILGGGLSDWQWSRRRSMPASGKGSAGAHWDALDSVRRAGDARSARDISQRGVERVLGIPRGARGSAALQ